VNTLGLVLINGATSFVATLVLSLLAFPWKTYHGHFSSSSQRTTVSYFMVSVISAVLCSALPSLVIRSKARFFLTQDGLRQGLRFATIHLLGLLVVMLMFSGVGFFWEVPGTRVRGIFFSEFHFVWFAYRVGLPVCLLAAALSYWWRTQEAATV